jgi:ClpP class serine protease
MSLRGRAFTRFKDIVKGGRPVFREAPQKLDDLATGEIFTAGQAKNHGLIDELGFIEDAIDRAIELAKLNKEQTRVVEYEPPPSLFDVPFLSAASARQSALALVLDLNTLTPGNHASSAAQRSDRWNLDAACPRAKWHRSRHSSSWNCWTIGGVNERSNRGQT